MRFLLEIRLGNAEMSNGGDVAQALRKAANKVNWMGEADLVTELEGDHVIRDVNGQPVGSFVVEAS